ncbi:MAG: type II toxin-antitoxin system RelE/ParE family toxin [Rhizobiales bacterium]|nr:type II toxin-antitoxin system RelE/ParE family toxin [Hyphomicrobiales bacterium]
MSSYRLSARADRDLGDIFFASIELFGPNQARRYRASLGHCFSLLADNPRMGRSAAGIAPGVRRHEHGSHVILYREVDGGVLILALVHGRSVRGLEL